ncbi:hypothetical protein JCM18918_4150 [Cutibacterium acnes JCM 18918]|nr:hypothetical protein JCM18918_4150 [Cutibacterium acnes JCM 18918]
MPRMDVTDLPPGTTRHVMSPEPPIRGFIIAGVLSIVGAVLMIISIAKSWHEVVTIIFIAVLACGIALAVTAAWSMVHMKLYVDLDDKATTSTAPDRTAAEPGTRSRKPRSPSHGLASLFTMAKLGVPTSSVPESETPKRWTTSPSTSHTALTNHADTAKIFDLPSNPAVAFQKYSGTPLLLSDVYGLYRCGPHRGGSAPSCSRLAGLLGYFRHLDRAEPHPHEEYCPCDEQAHSRHQVGVSVRSLYQPSNRQDDSVEAEQHTYDGPNVHRASDLTAIATSRSSSVGHGKLLRK